MAGPNDWFVNPTIDSAAFQQSLKQYIDNASANVPTDPLAVALGVQFEPFPAVVSTAEAAPTTQAVFGTALYATAGAQITGVKMRNGVSAAGTNPVTVRFGLADNTGKILALSGNYGTGGTNNATTIFGAGVDPVPFSAPFTLTYSGIYFPCFIINGAWGTTQPTPAYCGNAGSPAFSADGVNPPPNFTWAGQTDLPAVGSSATITTPNTRSYYLALY